jgi:hypothetical protein
MSDTAIVRAAERVEFASRALDAAADDLHAAGRRGLLVNSAADVLEREAERIDKLARVVARLEVTAE